MQFKEVCKNWSSQRNQELQWVTIGMERTPLCWVMLCSALKLSRTMQAMSLGEKDSSPTPASVTTSQSNKGSSHSTTTRKLPPGKSSLGLPSISSSEWDFEELTLPPAPQSKKWNGESPYSHCKHCFTEPQEIYFLPFCRFGIANCLRTKVYRIVQQIIPASMAMLRCTTKIAWLKCAESC